MSERKIFTLDEWFKEYEWMVHTEGDLMNYHLVTTNGCFDLLHIGHIRCLREARLQGYFLMVLVNDDDSARRLKGYPRPLIPCEQRMEIVAALEFVYYVIPFSEDTPVETLERMYAAGLGPSVHVKAADYRPCPGGQAEFMDVKPMPEAKVVTEHGGRIHITGLVPNVSTTGLIERIRKKKV